ncbi:MAG: hypothetical protein AAF411_28850 [Myxococcota bacterium]
MRQSIVGLHVARILAALLFLLAVVPALSADAQRRRRRRRRRPPPPPQAEPEEPTTTLAGADGEAEAVESEEPPAEEPAPAEAPPPTETEPEVEPAPEPVTAEPPPPPDLSPLRADLAALMDSLVQTRSRVAVLGRQLFQTKVRVRVENRFDDASLDALSIRLDGSPVFVLDGNLNEDGEQVFEGFAAPGPHELSIEAQQRPQGGGEYRLSQNDRFRFEVLQGVLTEITVVLDGDADIAEDFPDDREGEYDLQTRVRVATRELESEE